MRDLAVIGGAVCIGSFAKKSLFFGSKNDVIGVMDLLHSVLVSALFIVYLYLS